MKYRNFILFILSCLFFSVIDVEAANICSANKYNALKKEAYKVAFAWDLKFDENNESYFEITVSNMSDQILLKFNDIIYDGEEIDDTFVIETRVEGGKTYKFNFYGGYSHPCVEEYVYTKSLSVPKYNKFSEYKECIEYEEFPLCNKWYEGFIRDEADFYDRLETYKKSLLTEEVVEQPEREKNIFEKVIEFYVNNILITLPATIIIIAFILVIVIVKVKRSKNRVKINLDV